MDFERCSEEFINFNHTLRLAGPGAVVAIDTEFPGNLEKMIILLRWKKSCTSWYGKYISHYFQGFIYTFQVVQDFFHQQYEILE